MSGRAGKLQSPEGALHGLSFFNGRERPDQQELLHLQVVAIFRVTFLIVMEEPPFFTT